MSYYFIYLFCALFLLCLAIFSFTMSQPNPYILAADNPSALLPLLRSNPSLASCQDDHGYSLLHAAASYGHLDLLRSLVKEFNVNVNLTDEDGETCLFVVETVEAAQCLIEELGVDRNIKNNDGLTAEENITEDGSLPMVAAYLTNGNVDSTDSNGPLNRPPPLPPNVSVNVGTTLEEEADGDAGPVDPEFRRRIEELASKENFHSEEGQRQLRELVTEAIRGVNTSSSERDVRRRID